MATKRVKRVPKKKLQKHKMSSKRAFLRRMMRVGSDYTISKLDMIVIHEIFSWFPEEIDFMEKVNPPPFKLNNILWFKTDDGKSFLQRKLREFHYNPPKEEKPIDLGRKFGEDVEIEKRKTIRQFLE